jgi:uncharacterized protein (TIGR00369 family)
VEVTRPGYRDPLATPGWLLPGPRALRSVVVMDPATDGFADGLTAYFDLAARRSADEVMSTWVTLRPDLRDASGAARTGVVAYAVDTAVGMASGFAALPDWVVTADIELHLVGPAAVGPLRADARVVRAGSRQVLAEFTVVDEGAGDALVGVGTANHAVLPPDRGVPMVPPPPGKVVRNDPPVVAPEPLAQRYPWSTVAPGVVELALSAAAKNPWGIMHGSLYALLAEEAAHSVLGAAPPEVRIVDVVLRFLAPVRGGPARARAEVVGRRGTRALLRVEVRDPGAGDRLACLAFLDVEGRPVG